MSVTGKVYEAVILCVCVCVYYVYVPKTSGKLIDSYYSSLAHRFRDCEYKRENDDETEYV